MAAEVPVSHVLCEAMEYLSKLGSNLQTRSRNLKEKRIRKDKLKNSHAVQKAASKVLLICELSKKSLDNVEIGVRKVLSLLEASQAPLHVGGNSSDTRNSKRVNNYHYFEYQSRKLRIAKKISLKHFTSVKVLARGMSQSLQEKYPVYYDCKLKRQRQRLISKTVEGNGNSDQELSANTSEAFKTNELSNPNDHETEIKKTQHDLDSICNSKENLSNDSMRLNELDRSQNSCKSADNQDKSVNKSTLAETVSDDDEDVRKSRHKRISKILSDEESQNSSERLDPETLIKSITDNKMKKKHKVRFAAVYSSDSNDETSIRDKENVSNIVTSLCSDEENTKENYSIEPEAKKLKLAQSDDDSSNTKADVDKDNQTKENSFKKDEESDNSQGTESSQNGSSKPLIRCVNLSKLLKPNLFGNESKKTTKTDNLQDKNTFSKRKVGKTKLKKNDDEYWAQKRAEVASFKPKSFFIDITRLPNLTVGFLHAHNLRRIVKKGNVICEIEAEIDPHSSVKINAVKEALLNDSESDDSRETSETNKHKKFKEINSEPQGSNDDEQNKDNNKIVEKSNTEPDQPSESTIQPDQQSESEIQPEQQSSSDKPEANELNEELNLTPPLTNDCGKESNEKNHDSLGQDKDTPRKVNQRVKLGLLNDSSDEKSANEETPTKNNARVKSSLLKDSSEENSEKSKETSNVAKYNSNDEVSKSAIENETVPPQATESSDVQSNESDDGIKKRKTPMLKRLHARKNREAKKRLAYSSSSEGEEENKPSLKDTHKLSQTKTNSDSQPNSKDSDNSSARNSDQVRS